VSLLQLIIMNPISDWSIWQGRTPSDAEEHTNLMKMSFCNELPEATDPTIFCNVPIIRSCCCCCILFIRTSWSSSWPLGYFKVQLPTFHLLIIAHHECNTQTNPADQRAWSWEESRSDLQQLYKITVKRNWDLQATLEPTYTLVQLEIFLQHENWWRSCYREIWTAALTYLSHKSWTCLTKMNVVYNYISHKRWPYPQPKMFFYD
jgi:hypothetical protein